MSSLFSNNFLANRPIELAMEKFARHFTRDQRVLDVGCGRKPYASSFACEYIGIDPIEAVQPDMVGVAWDLPVEDASFDGVVLNQSLEHIAHPKETVSEVWRILKPGGYVIVTTPQTMKNHSRAMPSAEAPVHNFDVAKEPYWRVDYFRFTKFGLLYLFQDFKNLSISPTTGYGGTLFQLVNYFFASLPYDRFFAPLYLVSNVFGIAVDSVGWLVLPQKSSLGQKFDHFVYGTLTINYIAVFKKPAHDD